MKFGSKICFELWKILDDIDTASDMAKGDDALYRKIVTELQKKRWEVLNEHDVDELYEVHVHDGETCETCTRGEAYPCELCDVERSRHG